MGRLSHIDDIEKKNAEQQCGSEADVSLDELYQAAPATSQLQNTSVGSSRDNHPECAEVQKPQGEARPSGVEGPKVKRQDNTVAAQSEADFHGLNDIEKTSGGHLALIVLSVAILVAIIFYIFNYMS